MESDRRSTFDHLSASTSPILPPVYASVLPQAPYFWRAVGRSSSAWNALRRLPTSAGVPSCRFFVLAAFVRCDRSSERHGFEVQAPCWMQRSNSSPVALVYLTTLEAASRRSSLRSHVS